MDDKIPEGLEDLLKGIIENDEKIPEGLDDLLDSVRGDSKSSGGGGGGALATIPKKPDDLVDEEIDSQILSILGLEDVFDLTYEEYASLLKEAAVKGRMTDSQMTTESIELITNEFKRVKGKTGKFKVKPKKVDINKVLNRKPGAIVKVDKIKPEDKESEAAEDKSDSDEFKKDVNDGINKILGSLITIKSVLDKQNVIEKNTAKSERKTQEKEEKRRRENKLEKKRGEKKKKDKEVPEAKPIGGFFDNIKRFFTNILIGGALLKLVNWMQDPDNKKSIDKFKNFMVDNAPLILGGLLAIAAVPLVATILGFLAPFTTILMPAITAAISFLASPAGLAALAIALGIGGTLLLGKTVVESIQTKAAGGKKFKEEFDTLKKSSFENSGITVTGSGKNEKFSIKKGQGKGNIKDATKYGTDEQKKAIEEYIKKRDKVIELRDKMRAEMDKEKSKLKQEDFTKEVQGTGGRSGRDSKTTADPQALQKAREEVEKKIREKYELELGQMSSSNPPTVQPSTPKVPGKETANKDDGRESSSETVNGSAKVVPASHPETGSGYTVQGQVDQNGRPVVFSNPAAQQFAKAVEDSGMNLGQYVASSGRSEAKNASLKGADPNSHHMYGEALDMNGAGYEWMKENGSKYGWRYVYNHGPGSAHFKYVGPGAGSTPKLSSPGSAPAPPSAKIARTPVSAPSISSPTGRSGIGGIVPLPMGGGQKVNTSSSGAGQTKLPFFSSEDPNNMTMMVVKGIYNVVG
jgi:hypothetical protein